MKLSVLSLIKLLNKILLLLILISNFLLKLDILLSFEIIIFDKFSSFISIVSIFSWILSKSISNISSNSIIVSKVLKVLVSIKSILFSNSFVITHLSFSNCKKPFVIFFESLFGIDKSW